jgi:hypothetical protein
LATVASEMPRVSGQQPVDQCVNASFFGGGRSVAE